MQIYEPNQIDEIVFELKSLKAGIVPTDTVFGLVSLESELIYTIKRRNHAKKIIIFINENYYEEMELPDRYLEVIKKFWPGKLTIIYQGRSWRFPKSDLISEIIDRVGPLYSSSANISDHPPIKNYDEANQSFKKKSDKVFFVRGGTTKTSLPSTIISLDTLTVIRKGEINGEKIIRKLKSLR